MYGILENHAGPIKGQAMKQVGSLNNGWIYVKDGRISNYGFMSSVPKMDEPIEILDAGGRLVLPTFIDSHTHIVYAEPRDKEFVDRLNGMTYEEIAARGGGILNSSRKLQMKSEDDLYKTSLQRLRQCIRWGTGAIEIKSGYGLTPESELTMLRVIRRLAREVEIPVKATFLGAHAIPVEFKNNREGYIKQITDMMLPTIKEEKLADFIDVFCDQGFFTPEETSYILSEGEKFGLKAKIHGNELGLTGGVQVAVKHNAISVDHLEHTTEKEYEVLATSNTMPVLLPTTAFFLGIPYPDARSMISYGLPVALASDFNPGSSPGGNMSFVMSLACIKMKMTPEEAFNASTINAAYALELADELGSITQGKRANLIITKPCENLSLLPYHFSDNLIEKVIINGKIVS